MVGAGGRGGGAGRRKEGLLGGGRGWKVKMGDEGEDSGEDIREDGEEEKVDGETGESCSEPEREEEEPETNTHKESTTEAREIKQRIKKMTRTVSHSYPKSNIPGLNRKVNGKTERKINENMKANGFNQ